MLGANFGKVKIIIKQKIEKMKVYTAYPVIINSKKINAQDYYLSADGESYLPFDGKTYLEKFVDEKGDTYYYSADGEEFYNAKGQRVKGVFKAIGKGFKGAGRGIVKAGKFIGKIAKKVSRAVVKASKDVAKGVKTAGGKAKEGAKKLIHHKKRTKTSDVPNVKSSVPVLKDIKEKDTGMTLNYRAPSSVPPPANAPDVFTEKLPMATAQTPPEKVVEVAGQKFDTTSLPPNKEIVQTTDENGNQIAGVEYQPSEVIAVTGSDGNIEYYKENEKSGMSKGLKIGLIVGGVILAGVIGYLIYSKYKNKATPIAPQIP
jgi:hypothetical protein